MATRPSRVELFAFYYIGFAPDGRYKFPNAHHVAGYYKTSADDVMNWLDELDLNPKRILQKQFDLPKAAVTLQLEAGNMAVEVIHERAGKILAELDAAPDGRKVWED